MSPSAPAAHVEGRRRWAEAEEAWLRRLEKDRRRAHRNQTAAQRAVTAELIERARAAGCEALALTGSTARDRRTAISDLDYHVVGSRPRFDDLPEDVDIYATDSARLWEKVRSGDDYVQWTLRYGCVLVDDSRIFRDATQMILAEGIWPSADVKLRRLPDHRRHAERLIESGDRDAAQDQVRATLTAAARAALLDARCFPLARSELPDQLESLGLADLAAGLRAVIHGQPSVLEMADALRTIDALADRPTVAQRRDVVVNADGSWAVVQPAGGRPISRHGTQREAIARAREILRGIGGGELVIHARDGRIRETRRSA